MDIPAAAYDVALWPIPLPEIGPGVLGLRVDTDDAVWLVHIAAMRPGAGDVSRYLDDLPHDRAVVVPSVISARLMEMLERRGFMLTELGEVMAGGIPDLLDGYVRLAT